MHRPRFRPAVFALLLATAGCGSQATAPAVATAQTATTATTGTPSPSASAGAVAQYVDAQRKWVGCMRDHGYNLPDPDARGTVDLGAFLRSANLPKTDPALLTAEKACAPLQVAAPEELSQVPPRTAEQIENLRKYAKCMRANGVPTYPDPLPNGDWPPNMLSGTDSPQQDANNALALQICDPVIDGRPPASPDPSKTAKG